MYISVNNIYKLYLYVIFFHEGASDSKGTHEQHYTLKRLKCLYTQDLNLFYFYILKLENYKMRSNIRIML